MEPQIAESFEKLIRIPGFHGSDESPVDYRIGNDVLLYLLTSTDSSMVTLETGAGFTTAVLALSGCQHTVIAPAKPQFRRIQDWCMENIGNYDMLTFIQGKSQDVLPNMKLPALDLVILDGAHEFPLPCVDFCYTVEAIKKGGRLVLDDINIPSVAILVQFLIAEEKAGRWKATHGNDKTVIFEKTAEFGRIDWFDQPFNAAAKKH